MKYKIMKRNRFRRWLQRKALEFIVKCESDSRYVAHYKNERRIARARYKNNRDELDDRFDEMMDGDIVELLSVLEMQGDTGFSMSVKTKMLQTAMDFGLFSPLEFSPSEWSDSLSLTDNVWQNTRRSSVFREYDEKTDEFIYTDNDSLRLCELTTRYDIGSSKTATGYPSTFSGVYILYDEDTCEYHIYRNVIVNRETYMGRNTVKLPCVTFFDSNDTKNDFFCHIALRRHIPSNFFKDYALVVNENMEKACADELAYCREHKLGEKCAEIMRKSSKEVNQILGVKRFGKKPKKNLK